MDDAGRRPRRGTRDKPRQRGRPRRRRRWCLCLQHLQARRRPATQPRLSRRPQERPPPARPSGSSSTASSSHSAWRSRRARAGRGYGGWWRRRRRRRRRRGLGQHRRHAGAAVRRAGRHVRRASGATPQWQRAAWRARAGRRRQPSAARARAVTLAHTRAPPVLRPSAAQRSATRPLLYWGLITARLGRRGFTTSWVPSERERSPGVQSEVCMVYAARPGYTGPPGVAATAAAAAAAGAAAAGAAPAPAEAARAPAAAPAPAPAPETDADAADAPDSGAGTRPPRRHPRPAHA
jgi:hypothetical protein